MTELTWQTKTGLPRVNPFVGPRSIRAGEALFGRDDEVRELFDLLRARRIVMLHSPSGAGKSSLVEAGLAPRLKEARFDVWRSVSVDLDPEGMDDIPEGTNPFLLSTMVSLEDELPRKHRRSPAQLAKLDLLEYLDSRPRRKGRVGRSVVLLFDHFERVLTLSPRAVEAKREFFASVGRALESESYWALFIIREEHLAAFAPYRKYIPTELSTTYQLDLLTRQGAREAAVKLALEGGRTFPAVDTLIGDLSTVTVQQPDGSAAAEPDSHVEPVHLQVVCRRLWDAIPEDDLVIDDSNVEAYAEVSEALGGYYADTVRSIAAGDLATERSVRDWVGEQLIVGGVRSQVRQQAGQSAGLDNRVIDALKGSYLVRTEQRAGASWFELSRDRLVEPILRDNARWEKANLHPVQLQAKRWESGHRARALLLGADALAEASSWAAEHPDRLTPSEGEFLDQSRALAAEQARRRRTRRVLLATLATVATGAIAVGGVGWWKKAQAERALTQAEQGARIMRDAQRASGASMLLLDRVEMEQLEHGAPDRFLEGLALLAEAESDLEPRMNERERGRWPEVIGSLLWLVHPPYRSEYADHRELGAAAAGRSHDELLGLLWLAGDRCLSTRLRMRDLGRTEPQATADLARCEAMRACIDCTSTGDQTCLTPRIDEGPLLVETKARFDRCLDEFRRARAEDRPFPVGAADR